MVNHKLNKHNLISLWHYFEAIFLTIHMEVEDMEDQAEGWSKDFFSTKKYVQDSEQCWYWSMLDGIILYLIKNRMIKIHTYKKETALAGFISMLRTYSWSYKSQCLCAEDNTNDYFISNQEWQKYLETQVDEMQRAFILKTIQRYYDRYFILDDLYQDRYYLAVRYILLSRPIGLINSDVENELLWYAERLSFLHTFGGALNSKIENGKLYICFIIPYIFMGWESYEFAWADQYFEPAAVLLMEIIDRIISGE